MSIRVPADTPIAIYGNNAAGNSAGLSGLGQDGFSLYAALRDLGNTQGGSGDKLVSWPYDPRLPQAGELINMVDQRLMLMPQLVKGGLPITGVAWVQPTAGVYTANNNNKIGAYTYDGTQFTRVAQCASDGTLWKSTGYQTKPFTAAYTPASDMLLWAAGIWCQSAIVTTPQIVCINSQDQGAKNLGLTGGGTPGDAMQVGVAGATDLSATILDAALNTSFQNEYWLAFYHTY